MVAQPAILLGSIPIDNPFPIMLILSTGATVVFGTELVIAALRVHPRTWLYVLIVSCVVLGAALMAWSGYCALYGPHEVSNPRAYFPHAPNPWYDLYRSVLFVNAAIVLLTVIGVIVTGRLLKKQKA